MIEAEFIVQALQMRSGIWEPNWQKALEAVEAAGVISSSDAKSAHASYDFLRRTETTLRRFENKNVSALPNDQAEQLRLSKRMNYRRPEDFGGDYHTARKTIHSLYQKYIKARL